MADTVHRLARAPIGPSNGAGKATAHREQADYERHAAAQHVLASAGDHRKHVALLTRRLAHQYWR